MPLAFLTALLFALASILANRSRQAVGTTKANLGRLAVGTVPLGIWAFAFGHGAGGPAGPTFIASGIIGLGIGDLGFFAALPLLGSRLTVVMSQCLATPVAALIEWRWLGTRLSATTVGCTAVILAGIVFALIPTRRSPPRVQVRGYGTIFGLVAALGQAVGAVLSRKGFAQASAAGAPIDGLTAAFLRLIGGLGIMLLFYGVARRTARVGHTQPPQAAKSGNRSGWLWVLAHGFVGPVLAMGTFQLALARYPTGIVLPITATAPLLVIPLAYWFEGERPSRRSLAGGALAVAGAVALTALG